MPLLVRLLSQRIWQEDSVLFVAGLAGVKHIGAVPAGEEPVGEETVGAVLVGELPVVEVVEGREEAVQVVGRPVRGQGQPSPDLPLTFASS
jgi:hypothetical protein